MKVVVKLDTILSSRMEMMMAQQKSLTQVEFVGLLVAQEKPLLIQVEFLGLLVAQENPVFTQEVILSE